MLKIPTASDTPPPLLAPLRRTAPEEPAVPEAETHKSKKRRHSGKTTGHNHSWEMNSKTRARRSERKQMLFFLIGGGVLLAVILAGVVMSMNAGRKVSAPMGNLPAPVPLALSLQDRKNPELIDPAVADEAAFLARAEPLARKFLAASTVEQLLPLIRNPDTAEARMRSFYPEGKPVPVGISKFNVTGEVATNGDFKSVEILTDNFDNKRLVFVNVAGDLKIDWESWVGWSEMPWAEFRSSKPDSARIFRVNLSPVDYYNFDFLDETKWQSYRLVSPDQESSLYGYVERGGELDKRIRPGPDSSSIPLTLKLKFPKGTLSNDQVEIESVVSDSWVEENPK